MNASPVRSFGKYLLDEEIARGGMSRVFLARLRGLGGFEKRLVVKQVLPELASDPRFITMFVQEAKTLVRMSHPHIAPVYELGVIDGVYFLAMEYVDGATLSEILRDGPIEPELVAHVGVQICDALHYAHDRFSIVHRDVTPRNVIVDEQGHARLLDFGIAAPVTGEAGDGLFGTPGYLSPEQAGVRALGPATDVFSLGAVLFEALTARRAFFARNVEEAREVLTMDGPDFYPDDGVPESLAEIVDRALERDLSRRYGSARELGRAMRSWLATHAPEGVGPELGERVHQWKKVAPTSNFPPAMQKDDQRAPSEVKTLATSQILDALLEGNATPIEAPDVGTLPLASGAIAKPTRPSESDEALEDEGPSTLAISRPTPTPVAEPETDEPETDEPETDEPETGEPEADEPETSEPETDEPETDEPETGESEPLARPTDETAPTKPLFAVLLAMLGALGLAWFVWPTEAPRTPEPPPVHVSETPPAPLDPDPPEIEPPPELPIASHPTEAPVEPPTAPTGGGEERIPQRVTRATLTVNSQPWAEVELDGRAIGRTPMRRHGIRAGRHTLVLRNPVLGSPARTTFEVQPGGAITLIGNLQTGSIERR